MLRILILGIAWAKAPELTDSNFEKKREGKNAFIMFYAPWCGHCKQMKPAFNQVAQDFQREPGLLVASVDCSGKGSQTCQNYGINSYPSLRYFNSATGSHGGDYQGSRAANELSEFIKNNLLPCNPATGNGCTDEAKQFLKENKGRNKEELIQELKAKTDEQSDIENQLADFKARVVELEAESATRLEELGQEIGILRKLSGHHDEL